VRRPTRSPDRKLDRVSEDATGPHHEGDIVYPDAIPFVIVHLVAFIGLAFTGLDRTSVLIGTGLYLVRMWAITGGFHRYFSHRSYRTSRAFQFMLAFLGQTAAQRGVIWWAATHRHHHRHSDTPLDVHSPAQSGFLFAHVGWIFSSRRDIADYGSVRDLTEFPELRLLDRHPYVPAALLGLGVYLLAGWSGLIVGFFLSTVVLYHCVFFINSLAHVVGSQRYLTGDDPRNNWWLALITLGEGWHNNHHHYQSSTRQGFRWWEIDITWYVLVLLAQIGLVWDLRAPPEAVVRNARPLGRRVIESVARDLAASFPADRIVEQVREAWGTKPTWDELASRALEARSHAEAFLEGVPIPHLPSLEEIRELGRARFTNTPSLDEIAERTREILVDAVCSRLLDSLEHDPI
jgi:stearoyl-CoA desaturase (delta-9 desaturase)